MFILDLIKIIYHFIHICISLYMSIFPYKKYYIYNNLYLSLNKYNNKTNMKILNILIILISFFLLYKFKPNL